MPPSFTCPYCGYEAVESQFLEDVCPACCYDLDTGKRVNGAIPRVYHEPEMDRQKVEKQNEEAECQHEPSLMSMTLAQDKGRINDATLADGSIEFTVDINCAKCGCSGSFAVAVGLEDINW